MSLLAYGINHHTAPIALREKLSFQSSELSDALHQLTNDYVKEAVILSTCNRTEIYTHTDNPSAITHWLKKIKSLDQIDLSKHDYYYRDFDAVKHIMRVACGLDSMMVGEPQVLGQMKQAYFAAENAGTAGCMMKQLFPAVFSAGKIIRTETHIGEYSMSIAYVITQLARALFSSIKNKKVLLIGAGETIELVATHFHGLQVEKIIVANRTIERSRAIANAINAKAIRIQEIPDYLSEVDIVISATASQLPILGKGLIETIMHDRNEPLLMVDLAVPRDIEPEVSELDHVHLHNIDDLQNIIQRNTKNRDAAVEQAELLIELQANQFFKNMRIFHARDVIAKYREKLDDIRLQEQEKALKQLTAGNDPKTVLEQFGASLMNKIMHHPTMKLREAASTEACDVFQRIKNFFE